MLSTMQECLLCYILAACETRTTNTSLHQHLAPPPACLTSLWQCIPPRRRAPILCKHLHARVIGTGTAVARNCTAEAGPHMQIGSCTKPNSKSYNVPRPHCTLHLLQSGKRVACRARSTLCALSKLQRTHVCRNCTVEEAHSCNTCTRSSILRSGTLSSITCISP